MSISVNYPSSHVSQSSGGKSEAYMISRYPKKNSIYEKRKLFRKKNS